VFNKLFPSKLEYQYIINVSNILLSNQAHSRGTDQNTTSQGSSSTAILAFFNSYPQSDTPP
jgi:hypothetical protein